MGEGTHSQTVISSSSGRQSRPHQSPPPKPFPLPRPSLGLSQTPQECSPVTCAAAAAVDVPLPPRPKETQRHLALTQLQKSWKKLCLLLRASALKFRRGRAGALTSRRDRRKCQGRALRFPSPLLGFHIAGAATNSTVTSPSLPLQQPPPTTLALPAAAA